MGNCLVTKLQEVVQNDELLKVGEIASTIIPNDIGHYIQLAAPNNENVGTISLRCIGNCQFTDSQGNPIGDTTTLVYSYETHSYPDKVYFSGTGKFVFDKKYNISAIVGPGFLIDINDWADYVQGDSVRINYVNIAGDLDIVSKPFTVFKLRDQCAISGSIDDLVKRSKNYITDFAIESYAPARFDLSSLEGCSLLASFSSARGQVSGDIKYVVDTNLEEFYAAPQVGITGSIEGIVDRAVDVLGKTTGAIKLKKVAQYNYYPNVTYLGKSLAQCYTDGDIPGDQVQLQWNAQKEITFTNYV